METAQKVQTSQIQEQSAHISFLMTYVQLLLLNIFISPLKFFPKSWYIWVNPPINDSNFLVFNHHFAANIMLLSCQLWFSSEYFFARWLPLHRFNMSTYLIIQLVDFLRKFPLLSLGVIPCLRNVNSAFLRNSDCYQLPVTVIITSSLVNGSWDSFLKLYMLASGKVTKS